MSPRFLQLLGIAHLPRAIRRRCRRKCVDHLRHLGTLASQLVDSRCPEGRVSDVRSAGPVAVHLDVLVQRAGESDGRIEPNILPGDRDSTARGNLDILSTVATMTSSVGGSPRNDAEAAVIPIVCSR